MVLRRPAHRAARPAQLPRVASLGLVAATAASPFAVAVPAMAAPGASVPSSPLLTLPLPATPLPTSPVATTPLPATPLPTTPPRSTSSVDRWVTVGSNVRSGPGTNYRVVGGLSAGTKVTGTYTSNGWFDMGNGRFVAGSLLTTSDPGGSTPAPPQADDVRWVTVGSNVRSGPGTGYPVVGGLSAGTRVTGSFTSNGWFDMGNGRFVAGSLLTATDPGGSTPAPPEDPAPPQTNETRWITAGANVRSGPGTSYSVVGGLAEGAQVTGSMTGNGWFDIGNDRFVYGQLTTTTPPSTTPPQTPPETPPPSTLTRWATANSNVRSGPGTQHSVVGAITEGAEVSGTFTSNNWFDMGNGRFVAGWLVTDVPPGDDPAPAPPPATVTGAMVLTEAAQYYGVPYLWGGSTPAGFDCSGYTSYVFRQLGITIPRTAAQQQNATTRVYDPRPGDLVFFGFPAYHVGIYAGNNTMWDSAVPGTTIQLRQIWDTGNLSYGRVAGVSN